MNKLPINTKPSIIAPKQLNLKRLNRVEVIDDNGRQYVNWDPRNKITVSYQDNEGTIKIFITRK